jgi:hypothetical protein
MKRNHRILTIILVLTALIFYGGSVWAESNTSVGASPSASARVDFQVVIPEFLLFQVGTAGTGNVDLIEFTPTATEIVNQTLDIAATAASGDVGNGTVTVRVVSNAGQVTIDEATTGALDDGAGNTISFSYINTASSDAANLPAPTLSDAGGNTAAVALTAGDVTVQNAQWTYTYDNDQPTPPAAGTYTATATYTASAP